MAVVALNFGNISFALILLLLSTGLRSLNKDFDKDGFRALMLYHKQDLKKKKKWENTKSS